MALDIRVGQSVKFPGSCDIINSMTLETAATIDRQTLLASIPPEWQAKFREELSRSPLPKLVAIQVSQQLIEAYRQRLEQALRSGELDKRKFSSPYLELKPGKDGKLTVVLTCPSDTFSKPIATTEKQVEELFKSLNFWEASASYMWFDLTKLAVVEMEKGVGTALETMAPDERLSTLYRYIFDEASDSLKSNFSVVLQVYIDQAAQLIFNKYDLPSKTLQDLEWLCGLGQKVLPKAPATHPDLFSTGITSSFATCKILWESVNILTQRTDLLWQPDDDGKLSYSSTLKDGRGKLIFWVTDNPEEQYPEALAGEAALAVIETFDIRAACMHLIYAAHVTTLDRPWEEEFIINDTQIASYLGIDKRKDLTKEKRLKLIERIAEQPAQILTFLHWSQQGGSIENFYVEKSRLWEVAIGYHGQRDLFGDIKCTGLTIRCRAGMWAKYFLNKRSSEEGKAFYQYGVLSKTLLQTITKVWQHSEGAARMLAWLSFKIRVSAYPVMLTPTLMEVAYGTEKLDEAQQNRDLRSELAKTWDNDLRILHETGWSIEFDPATYPSEIQPDWKDGGRGSNRRPKGFWEQLRTSRLHIYPPKEIADGIAKLQRKKPPTEARSKQPALPQLKPADSHLDGATIRAARERKGWSQADLGDRVNKTKMWVSLVERDKRNIKVEDVEILRRALELA